MRFSLFFYISSYYRYIHNGLYQFIGLLLWITESEETRRYCLVDSESLNICCLWMRSVKTSDPSCSSSMNVDHSRKNEEGGREGRTRKTLGVFVRKISNDLHWVLFYLHVGMMLDIKKEPSYFFKVLQGLIFFLFVPSPRLRSFGWGYSGKFLSS